jgi:hypothetical protein
MGTYDGFETTAARWLTETVNVYAVKTGTGMGGARQSGPQKVITDLKASIQPRSAFAQHNVMGWMPEQSHTMFCKALDENGKALDIRLGYEVEETSSGRWFKVIGPPETYNHPKTRKGHHIEVAVKVMAKL